MVCLCVLQAGVNPTESIPDELKQLTIKDLWKPLKPREIRFVNKLPKTRDIKVMQRIIRDVYLDNGPGNLSSLEDRQIIDSIRSAF
jgi:acetyl-CoA synthetase